MRKVFALRCRRSPDDGRSRSRAEYVGVRFNLYSSTRLPREASGTSERDGKAVGSKLLEEGSIVDPLRAMVMRI